MDKQSSFESVMLTSLSLMLVCVFAFSVWMYDRLYESTDEGVLGAVAASVRSFFDENEAVAAFLGLDDENAQADRVAEEAYAYIERYNGIYADAQ